MLEKREICHKRLELEQNRAFFVDSYESKVLLVQKVTGVRLGIYLLWVSICCEAQE